MSHISNEPPQPLPDVDTISFWQATSRGEIALCRCNDCRLWQHPPLERCLSCGGITSFEPISGNGEVFSFIKVNRASVPGFTELLPYAIAMIELDEQPGLRMVSRLIGIDANEVAIGQRVKAEIVDHPGGSYRVPVFRLVPS